MMTPQEPRTRKVAGHEVHLPDGTVMQPGVVELFDGMVKKTYPLVEEMPQTEWIGGTIDIRREGENLKAYKNNHAIK